MKKIISLIMCTALLLLVLVSCGDDECVHRYNRSEWVSDAENHWYAAECECEDAGVAAKAAHVDVSLKDGFCDICGYQLCNKTAYKTTYSYNANSHWKNPACDHLGSTSHIAPGEMAPHEYIEGSGAAVCIDCGYQCARGDEFSETWKSDETDHWHEPVCGHVTAHGVSDKAAHADVDENGKCDVCDANYTAPVAP